MSIQAMAWVLENSTSELGARLALLSIANHADRNGRNAYPSYATIGVEARMSRRGAIDAVERLIRDGHVLVKKKASPHRTNVYTIVGMPGEVPSPSLELVGEGDGEDDDVLMVKLASPEPSLNRLTAEDDEKSRTEAEKAKEQIRQMTAALAAKKSL